MKKNLRNEARHLVFHDLQGRQYICPEDNPIGEGGQGKVLRVAADMFSAVKLALRDGEVVSDRPSIETFRQKLASLRRLPVPAGSHIAMPIAILGDAAGYVMRLLGKTWPLAKFVPDKNHTQLERANFPEWLAGKSWPLATKQYLKWYSDTGGIAARLDVLCQTAGILADLHGSGLLFGDLSPHNIRFGEGADRETWLIDVDNICPAHESDTSVATPGYASPEVYSGEAPNSLHSDMYSFAILAFETLAMDHPFLKGPAASKNTALEEEARVGGLPWILDTQDLRNRMYPVNPFYKFSLTVPLFRLFSQIFGEGRLAPGKRPPIWMFQLALEHAGNMALNCPHCNMGVILSEYPNSTSCPFCKTALKDRLEILRNGKLLFCRHFSVGDYHVSASIFGKRGGTALNLSILNDGAVIGISEEFTDKLSLPGNAENFGQPAASHTLAELEKGIPLHTTEGAEFIIRKRSVE